MKDDILMMLGEGMNSSGQRSDARTVERAGPPIGDCAHSGSGGGANTSFFRALLFTLPRPLKRPLIAFHLHSIRGIIIGELGVQRVLFSILRDNAIRHQPHLGFSLRPPRWLYKSDVAAQHAACGD